VLIGPKGLLETVTTKCISTGTGSERWRECQILGAATLKRQVPDKVRTNEQITFLTKMRPVFIQSPPSAVSVTLSAFAAERPLLHHGASSTAPAARRLQRSIVVEDWAFMH